MAAALAGAPVPVDARDRTCRAVSGRTEMSSLVVQIFESDEQARGAAAKLVEAGFDEGSVTVVSPTAGDGVASALEAGRHMGHLAGFYAERLRQGRSLVAVTPYFGRAGEAQRILLEAGAVDLDLERPADPNQVEWGRGAPLSEALGWRVLSPDNPTPLSDALDLRTSTTQRHFMVGELGDPHWTFSSKIGMGLLSDVAAPLSSRIGMAVLSAAAAPLSAMLGLKTLLDRRPSVEIASWSANPAPLSSALGWKLLTAHR